MTDPAPPLDHFVYTVPSLQAGTRAISDALGIELTPGGAHTTADTANTLASLGQGVYLEVLGPNPAKGRGELKDLGGEIARDAWPDIPTFAVASNDLAAAAARVGALGLVSETLETNSRRTPDGQLLTWQGMYVYSPEYLGLAPFLINWGSTPHPSSTVVRGIQLASVYVTHPRPEPLREIYAALGVRVPVLAGSRPGMFAHLRHGERELVLVGSGRGLPAQLSGASAVARSRRA
jgi:hypothetical protein